MGKGASCLTWEELDKSFHELREKYRWRTIWRILTKNPIDAFFIDEVIKEGWGVELMNIEGYYGMVSYPRKKIIIASRLQREQRDVTLFHELVHVGYPVLDDLDDGLADYKPADYNSVVAEWIPRQCAEDNELVCHACQRFGLELQPYNPKEFPGFLPSHEALQKVFKQYWVVLYCG